jgi:hypothetical protein
VNLKHGHASALTKTYVAWRHMRSRCSSPQHPQYANYGGRGITVCPEWASYTVFLRDMGEAPAGMTLDRINNDRGYSKDNCRWATYVTQNRNTRSTRRFTFSGETLCQREWEERLGLSRGALSHRLKNGWSIELALSTPNGAPKNLSRGRHP